MDTKLNVNLVLYLVVSNRHGKKPKKKLGPAIETSKYNQQIWRKRKKNNLLNPIERRLRSCNNLSCSPKKISLGVFSLQSYNVENWGEHNWTLSLCSGCAKFAARVLQHKLFTANSPTTIIKVTSVRPATNADLNYSNFIKKKLSHLKEIQRKVNELVSNDLYDFSYLTQMSR